MRQVMCLALLWLALPATAQKPIETPEKILDKKFLTVASVTTGLTFSDSYTTTWARQNWLAGKTNVCNIERESPYLYGTHPTAPRVYTVAAGKSALAITASYILRRHHNRLWSLPMIVNGIFGLQGTAQNIAMCN